MNIAAIGVGYVGLSTAVLWARLHPVTVLDVVPEKIDAIKQLICPFEDSLITQRLQELCRDGKAPRAALNESGALSGSDVVLVAVPTNYSEELGGFDASIVEQIFGQIAAECPNACVVLRSTVQPGTTEALASKYGLKSQHQSAHFAAAGYLSQWPSRLSLVH